MKVEDVRPAPSNQRELDEQHEEAEQDEAQAIVHNQGGIIAGRAPAVVP